jgi:hypothetical protein
VRVSIEGLPYHHGYTLGCDWHLSVENFNKYVDDYMENVVPKMLHKSPMSNMTFIDIHDLLCGLLRLSSISKEYTQALRYLAIHGGGKIAFSLMYKSRRTKTKRVITKRVTPFYYCMR